MKKPFLLLLFFAFALGMLSPALAAGMDATLAVDNAVIGIIQSACEYKGELYILSSKGIYRWIPGPNAPEKLMDLSLIQGSGLSSTPPNSKVQLTLWEQGMQYLFTDGDALYALHPYTGQVFRFEANIMVPYAVIPNNQFFYTDQEMLMPKEIKSLVFTDGKLYMVLMSFTADRGDTRELFSWDLHSGSMQLAGVPGINEIFPGPPGELLMRTSPQKEQAQDSHNTALPTLRHYNLASGAYTEMAWNDAANSALGCAWREEDGCLYFWGENGKVIKALPDGSTQVKAYLPLSFAKTQDHAFFMKNGAYVYVCAHGLFVRDVSQSGEKKQKTVHVSGYLDPSISIAFSAKHPDISLIIDSGDRDLLSIQQSMVLGNADIDLYIVNTAGAYPDIKEKGYAAPMNACAPLLSLAKKFYPAVKSAIFEGDTLLAFPMSISPDTWTLNRTLWNKLNLGEYPDTCESFFSAVDYWNEKYAQNNSGYTLLESNEGFLGFAALIVKQYLLQHETWEEPVSFNDPAFRSAAQAALDHREALDAQAEGLDPIIMTYNQYLGVGYNDSEEVVTIPPPALAHDSPRMVKASMDLFVLNPISRNAEAALEFITFYAGQMNPTVQYELNETLDTPLRPVGFDALQKELIGNIALLESMLEKAAPEEKNSVQALIEQEKRRYDLREREDWLITKESILIYRELAQHLAVSMHSIFSNNRGIIGDEAIEQVIRRFADGQLTVDQFVQELDSKALMMFREGK